MALQSINPASGEEMERFEEHDADAIEKRLAGSLSAFESWRETSFSERAKNMRKAAEILKNDARRYAEIITREMGKPITQAMGEVKKCAWVCEFYADKAEQFLSPRRESTDAHDAYVRYDPIGPVLAVMPWNFPFWQVFRFAAPTLMAGNTGLLKHASNVPQSALAIERIFAEAGFPEGVFTTLLIGSGPVEGIIKDSRVRAVTLTGSEAAGAKVSAAAGSVLKKSVMELGGSDPFIVLADADIERAAKVGATARSLNTGQSCIAAKRFIVQREVAEAFGEAFKARLSELKMGDPMDEATDLGPMARTDLRRDLHLQVESTVKAGGTLLMGGEVPDGPGAYYPMTLIGNVSPEMSAAKTETFGPLAPILVVDSVDEAIRLANDSDYGLGGSIWTSDLDAAHDYVRRIESGAVFVNEMTKSDPRLPFGGIKNSGFGRELSEEGIREFVNIKTVWMEK